MPLVKITRSRQVTIPKELFETLHLKQGDYLEIEQEGESLVLKPKMILDRERDKAKVQFFSVLDRVWERNKDLDPAMVEKEVAQAIKEVRKRYRRK